MSRFPMFLSLWFCCMSSVGTCGVQKGPNAYQIIRYFDQIMLTGVNDSVSLSNLTKSGYVRNDARPVDRIYRLPPGETIELDCPVGIGESNSRNNEWTLNGKALHLTNGTTTSIWPGRLYSCSCRLQSTADYVSRSIFRVVNHTTGLDTIILEDHTHMHAGEYECIQHNNGNLVVMKRYLVSPRLNAREVFDPPMKDIWARAGESAHFRCAVRFHVLPDFEDRFIWRNDEFILRADGVEEFKRAAKARRGFGGTVHYESNGTCQCHSTMEIHKVTRRHTGLYQCWFRVDDLFDKWIVQTAYLHVVD